MVIVVNGNGYDALRASYEEGNIAGNSEINVGLIPRGFWNRMKEVAYKIECLVTGNSYCGQDNLSCCFDGDGKFIDIDSREEVSGKLETCFGNWGALATDQSKGRDRSIAGGVLFHEI